MKGDYLKELSHLLDDELVIVDDMGSSGLNDWRREVWLEIIDTRYEKTAPTVITTNFTREDIRKELGERCASRLLSKENCIIDLHGEQDLRQIEGDNKHILVRPSDKKIPFHSQAVNVTDF